VNEIQLMTVKFFHTKQPFLIKRWKKISTTTVTSNSDPVAYLSQVCSSPFPNIKYKFTSTKEI